MTKYDSLGVVPVQSLWRLPFSRTYRRLQRRPAKACSTTALPLDSPRLSPHFSSSSVIGGLRVLAFTVSLTDSVCLTRVENDFLINFGFETPDKLAVYASSVRSEQASQKVSTAGRTFFSTSFRYVSP